MTINLNDWLVETTPAKYQLRELLECKDGFTMSVQASHFHYCTPRGDDPPYRRVEIGYPSAKDDALMEYAETPADPTGTVYGYVPIEIVEQVIAAHGGIK